MTTSTTATPAKKKTAKAADSAKRVIRVKEHTVEVVSDSGEGAQKCAQTFGRVSAKMGNGVWTV